MSEPWAVHDTQSPRDAPLIGVPTSPYDPQAKRTSVEVTWNDGRVEEVKLSSRFRMLRLDSLDAVMLLSPGDVPVEPAAFAPLFMRALAGPGRSSLRANEIMSAVQSRTGLPRQDVERAWKHSRAAFEAMPEVLKDGSTSAPKYRLAAPLMPIPVPAPPAGSVTPDAPANSEEPAEIRSQSGPDDAETASRDELAPQNEVGASRARPEVTAKTVDEQGGARATELEAPGPLLRAERLEDERAMAASVGQVRAEPDDIGAILAMRRPLAVDDVLLTEWLASERPGETVTAALAEVQDAQADRARHETALQRFSLLLGRILKHADTRIPDRALADAFIALQASSNPSERHRGIEALDRLSAVLDDPASLFTRIPLHSFQAAVRRLGLNQDGPRARFLHALWSRSAVLASDLGWWRGFAWRDVRAVSSGALHTVVTSTPGLMQVVRAAVDAFADTIDSRRELGELLGAPRFAVEHLAPSRVSEIIERVGRDDAVLARWHAEIAREHELEQATRRVVELEEQARRAVASEAAKDTELQDVRAHLAKIQLQVEAMRSHAGGLTERERRQVLLDSAKAIAQIVATVEAEGDALDPAELTRKVSRLAERYGVIADAARGQLVGFDPVRHSAPGSRPAPGETVNVARTGYTWDDGEAAIVVLPALVTRMENEETRS